MGMEQQNPPRRRVPRARANDDLQMIHRRTLLEDDTHADRRLSRQVRQGTLTRLRPGRFVMAQDLSDVEAEAEHRLKVQACVELCRPGTVVSHVSAAILHGIDVWNIDLSRVHVTKSRPNSGHIAQQIHIHCSNMEPLETVEIGGLTVTSVARTVLDIGCTVGFEEAVVVADCALNMQLVSKSELADTLALAGRRRGIDRARKVVAFADERSESVGESRGRVFMHRQKLPAPLLQYEVRNSVGRVVGVCDFGLPEIGWVGEFDGRIKFGRLVKQGETAGQTAFREKRRQDLICDEDLAMLRWSWGEYYYPAALRHRFVESQSRAARRVS